MSVHINVHLILIAECAQDAVLLSGNRHDMTRQFPTVMILIQQWNLVISGVQSLKLIGGL
jgi:hypothetical protein